MFDAFFLYVTVNFMFVDFLTRNWCHYWQKTTRFLLPKNKNIF